MGGRGTYAEGNDVPFKYKTVGKIEGVKVLEGIVGSGLHDLPVESHSSSAYIKLSSSGEFKMLRIYNKNHYLIKEIAYHPEPHLDGSRKPILHIHEYEAGNLSKRPNRLLTKQEYEMYKKYFGGNLRWKAEK